MKRFRLKLAVLLVVTLPLPVLAAGVGDTVTSILSNPVVLGLLVSGALLLLGLALKAFHGWATAWGSKATSVAQKALATLLGFVDTTLTAHASAITKDVAAAKADGAITPDEIKAIAQSEVARIKAMAPQLIELVGKELGLAGDALIAWLTALVASKLQAQVALSPSAQPSK